MTSIACACRPPPLWGKLAWGRTATQARIGGRRYRDMIDPHAATIDMGQPSSGKSWIKNKVSSPAAGRAEDQFCSMDDERPAMT